MPPVEIEATLLIQSDSPEQVAAELASLQSIGRWNLQSQPSLTIQDRYYDTGDARLQRQGLSLRFRKINGETKLALKGEGKRSEWGALHRTEIEQPWSLEALEKILAEISGLENVVIENLPAADPSAALQKLGFQIIQDRMTDRTVRHILNERHEILAELALDRVTYQVDGQKILHYEIEVEAKSDDLEAVKEIVTELQSINEAKLRPWAYSKLATGKAIEALISAKSLKLKAGERALSHRLYEQIESHLEEQK